MMSIGKAMKSSSSVAINPNFPSTASLIHSTSLLNLKKRTYWPEKSYRRGPPRPRYKFVFESFQFSGIGESNCDYPMDEDFGAQYERTQSFSNDSENSSSKSSKNDSENSSSKSSKKDKVLPNISNRDRLALGLTAAGPLNLQEVKAAYRSCAMKWHPDHHQEFSKEFAEEKFKNCNAAYQSLCDKLSSSS